MNPDLDDNIYLLDEEFVRLKIAYRVAAAEVYLRIVDVEDDNRMCPKSE